MARFDMTGTQFGEMAGADSAEALFELGLIYATGRNCEPDIISAHKWFNIAAFRGYEAAKMQREELAGEMSREQIAAAQRAAREWLTTH